MTHNAGVEAAAKVMDDLDRGGFFAAAIRARAKRDEPAEAGIIDAMVDAAAAHFGIKPKSDDPGTPEVRRCMESILARLRADGVIDRDLR